MISDKAYTYKNVARWSKKFDVFTFDKLYFPVNLSNTHWTLLVVYMQRKEIHYYDSMSGSGKKYLEGLLRWLVDEAQNKKKVSYTLSLSFLFYFFIAVFSCSYSFSPSHQTTYKTTNNDYYDNP